MLILDTSVSSGLVWIAGKGSSSFIVLMGILCSEYVFVTGHSDSCSLRKSGPFCHLLYYLLLHTPKHSAIFVSLLTNFSNQKTTVIYIK